MWHGQGIRMTFPYSFCLVGINPTCWSRVWNNIDKRFFASSSYSLPEISVSSASFRDIRTLGSIYVDKTQHLSQILRSKSKQQLFLSRPRKFGKSMLQSTVEVVF